MITQETLDALNRPAQLRAKANESTNFLADFQRASLASNFAEKLTEAIGMFDETLDQDHEVGVRLVTFGQTVIFHVERIGFSNPALVFFHGTTDAGQRVALVQHVSQLSFLLIAMPKLDPNQPKRPFGFHVPKEEPATS